MKMLPIHDKKFIFDFVFHSIETNAIIGLDLVLKQIMNDKINDNSYEDQVLILTDFIAYIRAEVKYSRLLIASAIKLGRTTNYDPFLLNCRTAVFGTILSSKPQPEYLLELLEINPKQQYISNQMQNLTTTPNNSSAESEILSNVSTEFESSQIDVHDNVNIKKSLSENSPTELKPSVLSAIREKILVSIAFIKDLFYKVYAYMFGLANITSQLPTWKVSTDQAKPKTENTSTTINKDTSKAPDSSNKTQPPNSPLISSTTESAYTSQQKIKTKTQAQDEAKNTDEKVTETQKDKTHRVINRIFKLFTPSKTKNKSKQALNTVTNMFGKPKKSGKSKS